MDFEWDKNKARSNLVKHGIDFADAIFVFEDYNAITLEDPYVHEKRFLTIGMDCFARILVVVYTWRNDAIRMISARKATKRECKQYEAEL